MAITYRKDLARDLTPDEVDANFKELSDKFEVGRKFVSRFIPVPSGSTSCSGDLISFQFPKVAMSRHITFFIRVRILYIVGSSELDGYEYAKDEGTFSFDANADGSITTNSVPSGTYYINSSVDPVTNILSFSASFGCGNGENFLKFTFESDGCYIQELDSLNPLTFT